MSTTYPDLQTSFPDQIQQFPEMEDITADDIALVNQYQQYMLAGNFASANGVLQQIQDADKKILKAETINLMGDTTMALERSFQARYGPFYIVSETQPASQKTGDLWFQILGDDSDA